MTKWNDIITAPKDGTEILLLGRCEWNDYGNTDAEATITVGAWADWGCFECDGGWQSITQNPYKDNVHATHWMPLPEKPEKSDD